MKYNTILLFGAPGSGKGTQGKVFNAIPGFFHCACGDIFRTLKVDSELGRLFVQHSSRGLLVPDEATVRLWSGFIQTSTQVGKFHPEKDVLVLDGIPRNLAQARMLKNVLRVRAMFWLKTSRLEPLVRRIQRRALKENRLDDMNLDVIRARLKTHERETQPLVDHYGSKLVHRIDSDQTPAEVTRAILDRVIKLGIQPRV